MGELLKEAEQLGDDIEKVSRMGFTPLSSVPPIKAEMARKAWYDLTKIWESPMINDCDIDIPLTARIRINWFNF